MNKLEFEIGQWVITEDGYAQIMYIRPFFVEDYENNRQGRKNGEFIRYVYVCKILCGFDGKIRKAKRINIYTSINPIDEKGLFHSNFIKENHKDEYLKYLFYEDKISLSKQLFLNFRLDMLDFNKEIVDAQIKEINYKLYPAFTYKEFAIELKKYNLPFKVENLIEYGGDNKKSLMLRLDSSLYKVKDKETIFNNVSLISISGVMIRD